MIIQEVKLYNFQSHKNSKVVFTEGLNVLVGDTNHGKSSILRAIAFVLFNKWSKDYINEGGDTCIVELIVYIDGKTHVITRVRSYKLDCNDLYIDGMSYKNIGRGLLPQLSELTKLDSSLTSLIYAGQDDRYFLLSDTGTERARKLIAFSEVILLDLALKSITKKQKLIDSEIDTLKDRHHKAQNRIDELHYIDKMLESLYLLESNLKNTLNIRSYIENITEYRIKENKVTAQILTIELIERRYEYLLQLVPHTQQLQYYLKVVKSIKNKQYLLSKIENLLNTITIFNRGCELLSLLKDYKEAKELYYNFLFDISKNDGEIERTDKAIHKLLNELEVCPVCERKLHD